MKAELGKSYKGKIAKGVNPDPVAGEDALPDELEGEAISVVEFEKGRHVVKLGAADGRRLFVEESSLKSA